MVAVVYSGLFYERSVRSTWPTHAVHMIEPYNMSVFIYMTPDQVHFLQDGTLALKKMGYKGMSTRAVKHTSVSPARWCDIARNATRRKIACRVGESVKQKSRIAAQYTKLAAALEMIPHVH